MNKKQAHTAEAVFLLIFSVSGILVLYSFNFYFENRYLESAICALGGAVCWYFCRNDFKKCFMLKQT